MQNVIVRGKGICPISHLEGEGIEVWTVQGWQEGEVVYVGENTVQLMKFSLARPTLLTPSEGTSDRNWVSFGECHQYVYATEYMTWLLTDGRKLNPMLPNRTVPSMAVMPNPLSPAYQQGLTDGRLVRRNAQSRIDDVCGVPTVPDYVFGVIHALTAERTKSSDPRRRVLNTLRSDVIDWVSTYCVLGGYLMTMHEQTRISLDPAVDKIGWKMTRVDAGFRSDIYVIKGVPSGMVTLAGGIYGYSDHVVV